MYWRGVVTATTFKPQGKHGYRENPDMIGFAFPWSDEGHAGLRARCRRPGGPWIEGPKVDTGPWNVRNEYARLGERPGAEWLQIWDELADNGRIPTNHAGVDLTWGLADALGVRHPWKGPVELEISNGPWEEERTTMEVVKTGSKPYGIGDEYRDEADQWRRIMFDGRHGRVCDKCEVVRYKYLNGPFPCRIFTKGEGEDGSEPEFGYLCKRCSSGIFASWKAALSRRLSALNLSNVLAILGRLLQLRD